MFVRYTIFVCALLVGSQLRAADGPLTLAMGSWVCVSLEDYDQALERQQAGSSPYKLAEELFEAQKCIYMDDDNIEDMMAPFVQVHAREGERSKVSFIVEHYKRIEFLHRKFTRMNYTGWTDHANIKPR